MKWSNRAAGVAGWLRRRWPKAGSTFYVYREPIESTVKQLQAGNRGACAFTVERYDFG